MPALVEALSYPETDMRKAATNALMVVAPEVLTNSVASEGVPQGKDLRPRSDLQCFLEPRQISRPPFRHQRHILQPDPA